MSEESLIGVFICECGYEIASRLDVEALVRSARELPGVVCAETVAYSCSAQGLRTIQGRIRDEGLGRVVVAGCTPRTQQGRFVAACEEAGVNRYLFEMVDIREGCALVHAADRERATTKAKAMIAMGVAKVKAGCSGEWIETDVEQSVVVIGAGVAGLSAALHLADRGVKVTVVERAAEAGGMVAKLHKLYPSMRSAEELVGQKLAAASEHPNVALMLQKEPSQVAGHVGRYVLTLASGEEISAGVIIVATGARAAAPTDLACSDGRGVVDQLALEERLRGDGPPVESVVMIENSTLEGDEVHPWFRVCCMTAIKNAALLKRQWPESSVSVLFRDIPSEFEQDVRRASALGVSFRQYDPARPPRMGEGSVEVDDVLSGEQVRLPAALVVVSTPMPPQEDAEELARMLRLPADDRGFLVEPHVKLRPEQYASCGVFVAGSAHWPALAGESIWQGLSAASRAYALLAAGKVRKEPVVVVVDQEVCRGCGQCAEACPFLAITMVKTDRGLECAEHGEFLCTGCGVCVSICPSGAVTHRYMTDAQIEAMVSCHEEGS